MALEYKLLPDGKGIQMDGNGHPIVIDDEDDNKEFPLDAIHLYAKIPALQAEAKTYREEKQAVLEKYKAFGDIPVEEILAKIESFGDIDPEKAKEALGTVANLGKLDKEKNIEIERVKSGVAASYESKIKDINAVHQNETAIFKTTISQKDQVIHTLLVRGAFDRSEFIKEQTVLTPDIAYDSFGKYFQIEEDGDTVKVFALDRKGDKIFSKIHPGEYAPPEEAIGMVISTYPDKDRIMRTNPGGSGAGGNKSGSNVKRAQLEALKAMNPVERLNALRR